MVDTIANVVGTLEYLSPAVDQLLTQLTHSTFIDSLYDQAAYYAAYFNEFVINLNLANNIITPVLLPLTELARLVDLTYTMFLHKPILPVNQLGKIYTVLAAVPLCQKQYKSIDPSLRNKCLNITKPCPLLY